MSLRTVLVTTDSDGAFTHEREFFGNVQAVRIDLETLDEPDITITDGVMGTTVLDVSGLSEDSVYQPGRLFDVGENSTVGPVPVMGTLKVEVANGGAQKHGRVILLVDR